MTERSATALDTADRPVMIVDVRPTACGYRALTWALREAGRRDAILLALVVWPGDPSRPDAGQAEMEQALTAMVQRAVEETGVHGRTRVAVLTGLLTVAEVAASVGAELLVVGEDTTARPAGRASGSPVARGRGTDQRSGSRPRT